MNGKKWYKSKSIQKAFLLFVASLLVIAGIFDESIVSPDAGWVGIGLAALDTLLRLITKEPIT